MLAGLTALNRIFRKSHWCVLSAAMLSLLLTGVCTLLMGIPVPRVHDEFAYLLGADTYASGRIANPPHAMWKHLESFHVLSQPSYMPKYPPGQALFMALGQLLGHPYLGVCLSTILAAGALAWMLIAWIPWRYRWLCVLLAGLHPGLHIKWGHSYLGGAIAIMAASLLLGALFRSMRSFQISYSIIAAIGISWLAISRPFEGAVLTVGVAVVMLFRAFTTAELNSRGPRDSSSTRRRGNINVNSTRRRGNLPQFCLRAVLPVGIVLAITAIALMVNNQRITGNRFQLAYPVYEQQYGRLPLFLWQTPKSDPPSYRHAVFEKYYEQEAQEAQRNFSSIASTAREKGKSLASVVHFIGMGGEYLILVCLPVCFANRRYRLCALLLVPTLLAAAATPWTLTHYAAPAAPLILMLSMLSFVKLQRWLRSRGLGRLGIVMLTCAAVVFVLHSWNMFRADQALNQTPWSVRRQQLEKELIAQPGLDLVIVSYSDKHNPHQEWVYNQADIDKAEVVWARSISPADDRALMEYFSDRKVIELKD